MMFFLRSMFSPLFFSSFHCNYVCMPFSLLVMREVILFSIFLSGYYSLDFGFILVCEAMAIMKGYFDKVEKG